MVPHAGEQISGGKGLKKAYATLLLEAQASSVHNMLNHRREFRPIGHHRSSRCIGRSLIAWHCQLPVHPQQHCECSHTLPARVVHSSCRQSTELRAARLRRLCSLTGCEMHIAVDIVLCRRLHGSARSSNQCVGTSFRSSYLGLISLESGPIISPDTIAAVITATLLGRRFAGFR